MSRALPLVLLALIGLPGAQAGTASACPGDARLGMVAYPKGGALHLLDLGSCRDRILVQRGATTATFSADGQCVSHGWIFWWPFYDNANSASLDGRPLLGKRIAAGVSAGKFVQQERPIGSEARAIWTLSADGRTRKQLTTPPRRLTD
jgi:hypothetical protein